MANRSSIRVFWAAALALAAGCATFPLDPAPLGQDELDQFLASGRDARTYGITIYRDPAGARYEFANRVHPHRAARMDFISPPSLSVPVIRGRTGRFVDCHVLLDTSARQNWLLLPSVEAMDYRAFAPPMGEYPDHVLSAIPGYAGVANKLVFDSLHIESPVFHVPPARGGFGPLARAAELPGRSPRTARDRESLGRRTHVIFGAGPMQAFSYVRFDFPGRTVRFSTDAAYQPEDPGTLLACLPLKSWRGRPAVDATLDGAPFLLVFDTGGEFELSLPADVPAGTTLAIGDWLLDDVRPTLHDDHGLPAAFPARLGLGLLARAAVTLDFKQRRVWIESPVPAARSSDAADEVRDAPPVQYRGITP